MVVEVSVSEGAAAVAMDASSSVDAGLERPANDLSLAYNTNLHVRSMHLNLYYAHTWSVACCVVLVARTCLSNSSSPALPHRWYRDRHRHR